MSYIEDKLADFYSRQREGKELQDWLRSALEEAQCLGAEGTIETGKAYQAGLKRAAELIDGIDGTTHTPVGGYSNIVWIEKERAVAAIEKEAGV